MRKVLVAGHECRGLPVHTVLAKGDLTRRILAEADDWGADVVVIGHTTRRGTGEPFLSDAAQRVLEFSSHLVLVLPARADRGKAHRLGPVGRPQEVG